MQISFFGTLKLAIQIKWHKEHYCWGIKFFLNLNMRLQILLNIVKRICKPFICLKNSSTLLYPALKMTALLATLNRGGSRAGFFGGHLIQFIVFSMRWLLNAMVSIVVITIWERPWPRVIPGSVSDSKQKQSNKTRRKMLKPSTNGSMDQHSRSKEMFERVLAALKVTHAYTRNYYGCCCQSMFVRFVRKL